MQMLCYLTVRQLRIHFPLFWYKFFFVDLPSGKAAVVESFTQGKNSGKIPANNWKIFKSSKPYSSISDFVFGLRSSSHLNPSSCISAGLF